ncbi:MAG: acetylglutamate kinase [Acidobacteriia bacterium]|nr:acetylglutamate kinase [Terriglobia bacterium]
MRLVIKIGGALLDDAALVERCAHCVLDLVAGGNQVAVVHGGGIALTRLLERLGKQSEFVGGFRVTDSETRDMALMVLAGGINKKLVGALGKLGQPAIGICGGDGLSFRARKRVNGGADLGYVGEISSVDPRWLHAIWTAGAVPVIASLALGQDGEYYNINADQMAAACAVACQAERLAFLTDVNGVWDAYRCVIRVLPAKNIAVLREAGIVHGGMLPKLEACERALAGGVGSVHILPGAQMEALTRGEIQVGTELVS